MIVETITASVATTTPTVIQELLVTCVSMKIPLLVLVITVGGFLQDSAVEARLIDPSKSVEIMLNILLGGRSRTQGEGTDADGEEGVTGNTDERIRSALETLQQHLNSLSANISSLERIDETFQRIQDMAEDTNIVQQSILDYLGLEDEITTERPFLTEVPSGACSSDQFLCDNNNCITGSYQCDGDNDCGDGSDENEYACPHLWSKKEIVLQQNETTIQLTHPENGGNYDGGEVYMWNIKNENRGAAGYEITFDKMDIETCCDKLRFEGGGCNYGPYTYLKGEPVTIEGDELNVTWTTDSTITATGFILNITSLEELNKTECYEYTCDDRGRCIRVHYDDVLTWNDSEAACRSEGAALVVITDEALDDLVLSVVDLDQPAPYIGISGNSLEDMTWTTGGTTDDFNYSNWNSDFDRTFAEKICGTFYENRWQYVDCSWTMPYICQKY